MEPTIANLALDLALEWGEHFLKPTQPRLAATHPQLAAAELDEYDAAARAVMKIAFAYVYSSPDCERQQFAVVVRKQFPWVNNENIGRMHSQGQYYAMK